MLKARTRGHFFQRCNSPRPNTKRSSKSWLGSNLTWGQEPSCWPTTGITIQWPWESPAHQTSNSLSTLARLGATDDYYVELELPPKPNADFPYTPAGSFDAVDYATLLGIVERHLHRTTNVDARPNSA